MEIKALRRNPRKNDGVSTLLEILHKIYLDEAEVATIYVSTLLEILPLMLGGFLGF